MSFIHNVIKNPTRSLAAFYKLAATVIVKGELLAYELTDGQVGPATSGTTVALLAGVSNQAISAADALTQVLAIELFEGDTWIVDCTNNSDVLDNGQRMVLTSSTVVNNTHTTSASGIVEQVGVYGLAADKKIIVKFVL
jgi:PKD repeat protein